jgi:predicted DNA binding protein
LDKFALIKVMSVKAEEHSADVIHFVDISSEKFDAQQLSLALRKMPDIMNIDLARVGANRIIGSITSKNCVVCRALVESKTSTFIAPANTEQNCHMDYKVYIRSDSLPLFLRRLHKEGVNYKIEELEPLTTKKIITSRQQKVLKSALELGYYDYPKRINTEELASTLGVKPGTVSEILRRAEKNVIRRYFEAS